MQYPEVKDKELVGTYPALVASGGGFVWDEVLEYRVWCHPENGAPDEEEGDDYYYVFDNYQDALEYANENPGTEAPLALVLQKEHVGMRESGEYYHVKDERITEWSIDFLRRPRRTENTIPDFLSPDAPANKLDIIRGLV